MPGILFIFAIALTPTASLASEIDWELGLGGVYQKSDGIKDWDNDANISKVRMPALAQMNVFFMDRLGIVIGESTARNVNYTTHYMMGIKANVPIGNVRCSAAAGAGILSTSLLDPNTGNNIRTYHPKTVYGEAAIDVLVFKSAYVGVSYLFAKANDPGVAINNIGYSGTFQAVFLKLGVAAKF